MKNITLSLLASALCITASAQINHELGAYHYNNPIPTNTIFDISSSFSSGLGGDHIINGNYSTAIGFKNTVSAYSFASGAYSTTNGANSHSFGTFLQTDGIQSFTFGSGNLINPFTNIHNQTFAISWLSTSPAFVVRNFGGDQRVGIGTFNPTNKLNIITDDDQGISLKSIANGQRSNIEFRDNSDNLNWDITAYNNFSGGYGNMLEIQSHKGGEFWVHNATMLVGPAFDLDGCSDCSDYLLFVRKGIRTEKLKVDIASGNWADYVFDDSYELMPLDQVEEYIDENNHLPGILSAQEIEADGLNVGEMNAKLLEKVEELTLYIIEMKKQIEVLEENQSN